jgi:outer membrane protein assembly factor BamD (BamD/ComL family)
MHQDRLFRLAHAGYALNAYYVPREGWTLVVRARRADEAWQDTESIAYSHMTTAEMLDTMAAHAEATLRG